MQKTALSDEELRNLLDQPIGQVMAENPDIDAIINVWQEDRIKRALERVVSQTSYAVLATKYSDLRNKIEFTNLEALVLRRI